MSWTRDLARVEVLELVKADPSAPPNWRSHQLANRVKYYFELSIISCFQYGELSRQLLVANDYLPQMNERSHDGDVHLDRAFAAKHAGEHTDAMFKAANSSLVRRNMKSEGKRLAFLFTAWIKALGST